MNRELTTALAQYRESPHATKLLFYTDGAAPSNQENCVRGGAGLAVYNKDKHFVTEWSQTVEKQGHQVTNVECELVAFIEALSQAKDNDIITTDLDYIVKGYNKWMHGWQSKGWKKPEKHQELWKTIYDLSLSRPDVWVRHVKGHSGDLGNDHADRLAVNAAKSL